MASEIVSVVKSSMRMDDDNNNVARYSVCVCVYRILVPFVMWHVHKLSKPSEIEFKE